MLADTIQRHNDDHNNNNTTTTNFSVFRKEEDKSCESDDENINVEVDSEEDEDEARSEHNESDFPESRVGLGVSQTVQSFHDSSDASHHSNASLRLKSPSPNFSEPEDDVTNSGRKISKLSFGMDRILHQENAKPSPQCARPAPGLDSLNEMGVSKPLLSPVGQKHPQLSAITAPHQRTLPLDLVSPLSPFHSSLIAPDVCRMDSSSLEILPVRPVWPDVYVCPWTGVQRDRFGLVRRVGHPYQNRTPPKRKKPRTAFTRQQVLELEKRFTRQKYLASAERSALAKTLNMTDAQVKTWFQNRRTKWRRQTAEEREIERQAAHKFLMSLRQEDSNRQIPYTSLCGVAQSTSLPGSDNTAPSVVASVN